MTLYQSFYSKMQDICPRQNIAVAVSGGADSMALALLANKWATENSVKIVALTVDHGLRKESADEALQVKKWLDVHKIEHHILKWEGDKKSSNIQAEARDARYRLMAEFCKDNNIQNLLIAHNKEDQAETVLLRLMRGSGVDGLCGMVEETIFDGVGIVRPLLGVNRKYLRKFLKDMNQEWVEDPSNKNNKYARVNVRNFIEASYDPELLVERLVDTAQNMQRSRAFIEKTVQVQMADVVDIRPEGYCILYMAKFRELEEEAAYRILSQLIKNIGGEYYKPRFEKLQYLYAQITQNDFADSTLGGCVIYKSKKKGETDKIFIAREPSAVQEDIVILPNKELIWDNRFVCQITDTLPKGLKIGALGEDGLRQIADKIAENNLPKRLLYSLPAVKSLEKIIAAPHIGYYLDEGLREKLLIKLTYFSYTKFS